MHDRMRRLTLVGVLFVTVLTGCSHIPGLGTTDTTIAATHVSAMTLRLSDLPGGFLLMRDDTPNNAALAQQLDQPAGAATLDQLGRRAGTFRVFIFTQAEPSTINGPTQATVEVDIFDSASHAQAWLGMRQTVLTAFGPIVPVGMPGQRHFTRMTLQYGEMIARTSSVLAFTEQNAYVEITSVLLGPGPSLAEDQRYADLIDTRLMQS